MAAPTLSNKAYAKAVAHSFAHPEGTVCGVLVCEGDDDREICDAVPLFHSVPMAPFAEAALEVVDDHLATLHARMRGVYWRPATVGGMDDPGEGAVCKKIVERVGSVAGKTMLVELRHVSLSVSAKNLCALASTSMLTSPEIVARFNETLLATPRSEILGRLVDFEDSLDNPTLDWRNPNFAF